MHPIPVLILLFLLSLSLILLLLLPGPFVCLGQESQEVVRVCAAALKVAVDEIVVGHLHVCGRLEI